MHKTTKEKTTTLGGKIWKSIKCFLTSEKMFFLEKNKSPMNPQIYINPNKCSMLPLVVQCVSYSEVLFLCHNNVLNCMVEYVFESV